MMDTTRIDEQSGKRQGFIIIDRTNGGYQVGASGNLNLDEMLVGIKLAEQKCLAMMMNAPQQNERIANWNPRKVA